MVSFWSHAWVAYRFARSSTPNETGETAPYTTQPPTSPKSRRERPTCTKRKKTPRSPARTTASRLRNPPCVSSAALASRRNSDLPCRAALSTRPERAQSDGPHQMTAWASRANRPGALGSLGSARWTRDTTHQPMKDTRSASVRGTTLPTRDRQVTPACVIAARTVSRYRRVVDALLPTPCRASVMARRFS
jgi:hypothetical protein